MSFHYDNDFKCDYQEWVDRSGGLVKALDSFLSSEPEYRKRLALEFGSGNTTRVLAKWCKSVISVDSNEDSVLIPVAEQSSYNKIYWDKLKKEDNVTFIHGDILKMDFKPLKNYSPDIILFDVGCTVNDKYLYNILYERLGFNGIGHSETTLFIDNADACPEFIKILEETNYLKVTFITAAQAFARGTCDFG